MQIHTITLIGLAMLAGIGLIHVLTLTGFMGALVVG